MKLASEIAEALGAFVIVLAGCGAIMVNDVYGGLNGLAIAVTFGLAVGAMIYAVGHVSGAHFNPAVTIAFAASGHFPWARVPTYVMAQLVGGLAAAATLAAVIDGHTIFGETQLVSGMSTAAGFAVEVLITAILMFVIASVATDGRAVGQMAGTAIGSVVILNAIWAGPLTGASMNPMRSIGPGVVSGQMTDLWLYVAAPIVGALVGVALYEATRRGARPLGRSAQGENRKSGGGQDVS